MDLCDSPLLLNLNGVLGSFGDYNLIYCHIRATVDKLPSHREVKLEIDFGR